ncbi:MAG TPA: LacI family DNA-binding transcriptional regulator, partial [Arthrobacter sp.]
MSKQDTRRATISEIAREAGVSVPTVSKVLNGHAHVAAETRARVEEIIAKRDYARRPAKRKQKAGLVDLVFPGLGSEWALEIIEGVERVAQDAGYGTVVSSLNLDGSRIRPWLANLAERKSDGLLMAVYQLDAKQIQRVKSLGIPVVLIDPVGQPGPDLTTVGAANWEGGYSATEHLLQLGHKRIAMIGGREDLQCSS